MYEIEYTPQAVEDFQFFRKNEQKLILEGASQMFKNIFCHCENLIVFCQSSSTSINCMMYVIGNSDISSQI